MRVLSGFGIPTAAPTAQAAACATSFLPEARRYSAYRLASSILCAAIPDVLAPWQRRFADWRARLTAPSLGGILERELATPGFRVPLRFDIGRLPFWSDPLGRPQRLQFEATGPDGKSVPLGLAHIDAKGVARIHARFSEPGKYRISYRLKDIDYELPETGHVDVLDRGTGVVAVDADELVGKYGEAEFIARMNSYEGRYRLVVLTEDESLRDSLALGGLNASVIANDYKSSPFWLPDRRFPETQLEKLKRLKFVAGVPVIGIVSRPLATPRGYAQAGIEVIPASAFDKDPSEWFSPRATAALGMRLAEFTEALKKPQREFYLDGMTGSRRTKGNDVRFFTENAAARKELLTLIKGAQSFIHIANFGFQSDAFGKEVTDLLIARAREGIKVRIIMDALTFGPFPTEAGFVWMDESVVASMREAGIEIVMHRVFNPSNAIMPHKGPFSRRHRKGVFVDFAEDGGAPRMVAFGGGRIIGGLSYSDPVIAEAGYFEKLIGYGWGEYRDLSYRVEGPDVAVMQAKYIDDFRNYGGEISKEEEARLTAPIAEIPGGSVLRSAFHDSYSEQNTHNVVMDYLTDPDVKNVTLVNSFTPTDEILEAIIRASLDGKKVRYIIGMFLFGYTGLLQNAQRLIDAGVEVVVVPYQLHTKMYSNGNEYAYGNQNLDRWSQHDSEDLQIVERGEPHARALDEYVDSLMRDGHVLKGKFLPGEDPLHVQGFLAGMMDFYVPNLRTTTEASFFQALLRGAKFLSLLPFFK